MSVSVPPAQPPAFVAGLFGNARPPVVLVCPDAPATVLNATAPACPAVDVSGKVDATGVTLDPAFDILVPPASLTRTPRLGNATLSGYDVNGALLFTQSFTAEGPFHVDVPLAPARAQLVRHLRLVSAAGNAERSATVHGEPTAETVVTGDREILLAWDARQFPALRVTADNDPSAISYLNGSSTFEQVTLGMSARRLFIDFSDGVRSVARGIKVLGR